MEFIVCRGEREESNAITHAQLLTVNAVQSQKLESINGDLVCPGVRGGSPDEGGSISSIMSMGKRGYSRKCLERMKKLGGHMQG